MLRFQGNDVTLRPRPEFAELEGCGTRQRTPQDDRHGERQLGGDPPGGACRTTAVNSGYPEAQAGDERGALCCELECTGYSEGSTQ